VDIDFEGMDPRTEVIAENETGGYLNYVTCGAEIYNVKQFKKVTYKNVYKSIDIEFTMEENLSNPLKYNIILHPGANIKDIKFLCKGSSSIKKFSNEIRMSTVNGDITEKIPFSYYLDKPATNQPVNFVLDNNLFSFSLNYDNSKTLVIDPSISLIWSTYFGGSNMEYCTSTGTDSQNNVFLAGHTLSSSNIATSGAYQTTLTGTQDIFLAKFTSSGSLIWATYYGGSSFEQAFDMYVESNGTVYLTGDTASPNGIASPGAHQTTYAGGIDDAILAKFSASGARLWATYYGGTEHDFSYCVTVAANGDVLFGGHTESPNAGSAIATVGAYSIVFNFASDAFIARFNPSGVRQWGTYYGDSGVEETQNLATDAAGNVYATGFTSSFSGMTTSTGHQPFFGGGIDAFIAKFDPAGSSLIWGSYYGGGGDEQGFDIIINSVGNVFVCGWSNSNSTIATLGAYQPTLAGAEDAFMACFLTSGVRQWGTYLGGTGADYIYDMAFDQQMDIMFSGETISSNGISTPGAFQPSIGLVNTYDGIFGKFKPNGTLSYCSYFGGSGDDRSKSIAVDGLGAIYLSGESSSTVGITTGGSYQSVAGGNGDAFLAKFCVPFQTTLTPKSGTICVNDTYSIMAPVGYTAYSWNNTTTINPLVKSTWTNGIHYFWVTVTDASGCTGTSDTARVQVNSCITGIDENNTELNLELFPVPASEQLFFNYAGEVKNIKIYSATGQLMREKEIRSNENMIDISGLSAGIYLAELQTHGRRSFKKFVKD
jgi:hypothetical protein